MSARFDSLGYVRRLEQAGVDRSVAEAHADAARDFLLDELFTKGELQSQLALLEQRITIKLGAMLVVAVGAIVALEGVLQ